MMKFNAKTARTTIDTARNDVLKDILAKFDAQVEEASKTRTSLQLVWIIPECWVQDAGLFNTILRGELFAEGFRMSNIHSTINKAGSNKYDITIYW